MVVVVHEVRVYGEFGKLDKWMDQACAVINYRMTTNHLVFPHKKDVGQRLKILKSILSRIGSMSCATTLRVALIVPGHFRVMEIL